MDAPLRGTPHEDTRTALRIGYRLRGSVIALATAAAVASHLLLDQTEAVPRATDAEPSVAAATTSSAAPQIDHSVVLRQDLRDDALHPGASIAAYEAP